MAAPREIKGVRIQISLFGFINQSDRSLRWFDKKYSTLEAKVDAVRAGAVVLLDAYRQPIEVNEALHLLYEREGETPEVSLPSRSPTEPRPQVLPSAMPAEGPDAEAENEKLRRELEDLKQVVKAISERDEYLSSEFSVSRSLQMRSESLERASPQRQIFLSFYDEDYEKVEELRVALTTAGHSVWSEDRIEGDAEEDWEVATQALMARCEVILLVLSQEGLERERSPLDLDAQTAIELHRKVGGGPRLLVPIRLDDCEVPPIPVGGTRTLNKLARIDLFPEERWARGVHRLLRSLAKPHPSRGPSHPTGNNPS